MKLFTIFSLVLIQLVFASVIFGQQKLSKFFSPDNTIIPKDILQKRDIAQYFDGGAFRCGIIVSNGDCDYKKLREVIWQYWNEKLLCYLTISDSSVDASRFEHIFIESNKKNVQIISRRVENSHVIPEYREPLHNLPKVYSVEWSKNKVKKILVFKNRRGKVIDEY
jgi:signal peptidase I